MCDTYASKIIVFNAPELLSELCDEVGGYLAPIKYGDLDQVRNAEFQDISAAITASLSIISVICFSLKPNSASIERVCCP